MMEEDISEEPLSGENIKQEEIAQISTTIPLFIKKLWKMVNDIEAENIITWNTKGDGFIIRDQLQFITKLLPHYFKHNNMASFVRQLNFYNFHKVPNVNHAIEFSHDCFIKDMPEVLPFIRRKNPIIKPKTEPNYKEQEVEELLNNVKNLKGKHGLVDKELAMLKRENVALWTELNSLRVKYTKQSTIINMLIHFLITYIHSHQSTFSKQNIEVSPDQHSSNNIKPRPTLLEIGYKNPKKLAPKKYSILQPGTSDSVTYSLKLPENCAPENKRSRTSGQDMTQILSVEDQVGLSNINRVNKPQKSGITYSIKLPGQNDQLSQSDIQRSLLDILKENEQLCEEDTNDVITELDPEYEHLDDEEELQTFADDTVEEIATESSPGYTVSYPTENSDEMCSDSPTAAYGPHAEPIIESPQENVDLNSQGFKYDNPKIISKKIPIKMGSKITNYTITHPNLQNLKQSVNKNQINIVDHLIVPNKNVASHKIKTVPKFIKIPIKNVKTANNIRSPAANKNIKIPVQKAAKPKVVKMTPPPQSNNMSNAEGTLLEILKENEKLTNDELNGHSSNIMNIPTNNLENLINDVHMDAAFENFYSEGTGTSVSGSRTKKDPVIDIPPQLQKPVPSTVKNAQKDTNPTYNILNNPKERLSTYVDNTQEEIDMLQDILNDLTSKDLSDILNSESSEIPINIDDMPVVDEDVDNECIKDAESTKDYTFDESVDKYFKKHFLDF